MKKFILSLIMVFWFYIGYSQYYTFYVINDTIVFNEKPIAIIYPEIKEVITFDKESDDMSDIIYRISHSLYPNSDSFLIYYREGDDLGVYSNINTQDIPNYGYFDNDTMLAYYELGDSSTLNQTETINFNRSNDTIVINRDKVGLYMGYDIRLGVSVISKDIYINLDAIKYKIKLFRDISSEEMDILDMTFGDTEFTYDYPLDSTGHILYEAGKLKNESLNLRILGWAIGVIVPFVGYSAESTPLMVIGVGTSITMQIMSLVKEYRSNKLIQEAGINMQRVY